MFEYMDFHCFGTQINGNRYSNMCMKRIIMFEKYPKY
uniref:Uncharacterized protein n=1 Tax=Arundo donax TaxID=35708 RepID=A0A0A9C714_ARUDO